MHARLLIITILAGLHPLWGCVYNEDAQAERSPAECQPADEPPADIRPCPTLEPLVETSGYVDDDVLVMEAAVFDDRATVSMHESGSDRQMTISFYVGDADIDLPPTGPARLFPVLSPCHGEGCNEVAWRLSVDDAAYFEVGQSVVTDEGWASDTEVFLPLYPAPESAECDDGDDQTSAAAILVTPANLPPIGPGQRTSFTHDGAPWTMLAGDARRITWLEQEGDCSADCPEPGCHSRTSAEAVAFRTAE